MVTVRSLAKGVIQNEFRSNDSCRDAAAYVSQWTRKGHLAVMGRTIVS